MKLSYTQRVLGRQNRPALESENTEEVVDQSVIDAQPTEEVPVVEDDLTVVEEGTTDPEETPAEELPVDAGEVAADVAPVEAPVDGIEPVEPPQIVPVTDSGEATVDQVEAIAEGNPVEAAEVVAEVDNAEGADTTPEEVIAEAEEVEAAAPSEDDVTPEATEELTETEEAPVEVSDITPEGTEPTNDETVSDVDEVVAENLGEETPETDPVDPAVENCACESAGTNPPNEGGTGQGEQHLPSEQVEVDSGKGEEVKPEQTKPVADEAGNSDIEVSQEKPAAEGKGEAELPSESEVVDEGTGSNQNTGEVVSTENAEVVEEQVADAPSEVTPEAAAAVVTGAEPGEGAATAAAAVEPVVESLPEETAGEAPTEGVVEAVADVPVDLSPETDDGDVVADDLIIEDFQAGTEDEEAILEEALDTYPQVAEVLQNSLDNGGVSVEAMQILNIFTKRDGNPLNSDVALESYNFTARTQTRLAIESIGEDIKSWMAKFVELFKRAAANFKETMRKRFDQVGILERRAEALVNVDAGKSATGEVSGEYLGALTSGGKVDSSFVQNFKLFGRDVESLLGAGSNVIDAAETVHKVVRADVLDALMKGETPEDAFGKVENVFRESYGKALVRSSFKAGDGMEYTKDLLGDFQVSVLITDTSGAFPEVSMSTQKKDSEVKSAPCLSGAGIIEVGKTAAETLSAIRQSKGVEEAERFSTELIGDLERLSKLAENSGDRATYAKAELGKVRRYFSSTASFLNQFNAGLNGIALRTISGAIQYAEASAKAA